MEISTARNVFSFTPLIWRLLLGKVLECQLPLGSDYNYLPLQLQYAISESARPFSFLNGVQGKWCKLNFELHGIHAKKWLFVIHFLMSFQNHNNSCKRLNYIPLVQMKGFHKVLFNICAYVF